MNQQELEEVIADHPVLYHMAESGSWPSIQCRGLLSTSALLDLYGYSGAGRFAIESARRPESIRIRHPAHGEAIVRDQKPMTDAGLRRALLDGLVPKQWYRILNSRVFFWLTQERLRTLLTARPYAAKNHDVLFVETGPLVEAYRQQITLSPMNSGCTVPFPHKRGLQTFQSIDDYPYEEWRTKRRGVDPVVELAIDGGVPNIAAFVLKVVDMRAREILGLIWQR